MGHRLFFDEPERYTSTTRCNNHIDFFSAFPVEILQKKRQSRRRRNNHRGFFSTVQYSTVDLHERRRKKFEERDVASPFLDTSQNVTRARRGAIGTLTFEHDVVCLGLFWGAMTNLH